jgi:hypothetical protein
MIEALKESFMLGCREGWDTFWSPFTGLWKALASNWRRHVKRD